MEIPEQEIQAVEKASKGRMSPAFVAGVLALLIGGGVTATGLIPQNEGKTNVAYIPVPGDVPTICYGETHGVQLGDHKDDKECKVLLRARVVQVFVQIAPIINVSMPMTRAAALIDFTYNEGIGTFSRSSILRDLNAGRTVQACEDLLKYEYADGRRLRGLVKRREAERALCLQP